MSGLDALLRGASGDRPRQSARSAWLPSSWLSHAQPTVECHAVEATTVPRTGDFPVEQTDQFARRARAGPFPHRSVRRPPRLGGRRGGGDAAQAWLNRPYGRLVGRWNPRTGDPRNPVIRLLQSCRSLRSRMALHPPMPAEAHLRKPACFISSIASCGSAKPRNGGSSCACGPFVSSMGPTAQGD